MAVWPYRITDDTGSIKWYVNAKVNQDLASDRSLVLGDQKILANNIPAISNSQVTHLAIHISPLLFFQSYQCFSYIHESGQSWLQHPKAPARFSPITPETMSTSL